MTTAAGYRALPDTRRLNNFGQSSTRDNVPTATCLSRRQRDFAAALLYPGRHVPPGLVGPDGEPSTKRFNVYRNNVIAGLTAALKEAFPAVARIVGDEFFAVMARIYVAEEPPNSPIMLEYGEGFADFIGRFEPAETLPYLRDVARIERAWAEAYHAPDARPLDPRVFTEIGPDRLPDLRVIFHPSIRVVRSQYPSLAIWQMNVEDRMPVPVDLEAGGDDVLVLRPDADVEIRSLPPGGAEFIRALRESRSILEAMKHAMTTDHRFDLATNLSGLMGANALIGYDMAANPLPLARLA
ncbi:MAG: DNA-binding domain-containing protein [Bradyrhizobium sp.]